MKRLVLVGGGHGHLELLRQFAARALPAVRITLISAVRSQAYSGMLPGVVAGHYRREAANIDLLPLARRIDATFVQDAVVALNLATRQVHTESGAPVNFDYLSLDIGSIPEEPVDVRDYAVPIKPMEVFIERWTRWKASLGNKLDPIRVSVIGGGPGGVEILLATAYCLRTQFPEQRSSFHLFTDSAEPVSNLAPRAQALVRQVLEDRDIALHTNAKVQKITECGIEMAGKGPLPADFVVLATGSAPPSWLARTGLALDPRGFIAIDDNLRSLSHAYVFAAGDCASRLEQPYPKSGVYAVRQGPVLAANLRAVLTGSALRTFSPQSKSLVLISCGDRFVVAARGNVALAGGWLWKLKDRIDRGFVARHQVI